MCVTLVSPIDFLKIENQQEYENQRERETQEDDHLLVIICMVDEIYHEYHITDPTEARNIAMAARIWVDNYAANDFMYVYTYSNLLSTHHNPIIALSEITAYHPDITPGMNVSEISAVIRDSVLEFLDEKIILVISDIITKIIQKV